MLKSSFQVTNVPQFKPYVPDRGTQGVQCFFCKQGIIEVLGIIMLILLHKFYSVSSFGIYC